MKKRIRIVSTLIVVVVLSLLVLTNPTERDYHEFAVKKYGETPQELKEIAKLERINFFIFSTYRPIYLMERGTIHIGIMGKFIRISRWSI